MSKLLLKRKKKLIEYLIANEYMITDHNMLHINDTMRLYIASNSLRMYKDNSIDIDDVYMSYKVRGVDVDLSSGAKDMPLIKEVMEAIK